MKAIRIHEPAGISGLVFEEAPDAKPFFCDVLVKVAACGITHTELDYPVRTCRAGHQRTLIIPGAEVSGVVAALGLGTAGIAVGEEVFGLTDQWRDGTAAEYVAVEARNVAPKPATVDHVHAAAVPRAGLTAWQALFDHGQLAKGQTAIIHGAGGAVGSTAVQLARWAGAEVIGTGRSHSRSLVLELGADRFVALDADRLEDTADQADLVFDTIGGEVLARSPALLRPGGTLVSVAGPPPATRDDIKTVAFIQESNRAQLIQLARLVDEGTCAPRSGRCIRSRKQPRRSARRPLAASPAGSSSSPDPGTARPGLDRPSRPPQHHGVQMASSALRPVPGCQGIRAGNWLTIQRHRQGAGWVSAAPRAGPARIVRPRSRTDLRAGSAWCRCRSRSRSGSELRPR